MTHPCSRLHPGLRLSLLALAGPLALTAAEPGFTLSPTADHGQLGTGFTAAGDIDGDGITDIAVTDPGYRSGGTLFGSGVVHIVSGADGTTLRSYEGSPAESQYFGLGLASLDADGDGALDLAIGAPGHAGAYGAVWIYSGADGSVLSFTAGTGLSQFGSALANAGDQNGDGTDDLFVGAPLASYNRGAVELISGVDGTSIRTFSPSSSYTGFGTTFATLGDLDGDGRAEVAISSPRFQSSAGKVAIIRSTDGSIAAERIGTGTFNRLGESLATVADVNADGFPELLVGSYSLGTALLLSGSDLSELADLSLPSHPAYRPVHVGGSLDYDGDGTADWLIGSTGMHQVVSPVTQTLVPAGGIHILSGADRSVLFECLAESDNSGLGLRPSVLPGFGFAAGENSWLDPISGGRGLARLWSVAASAPEVELDSDNDGIPDEIDAVPNSIMDATVRVLGVDSGVENRVDTNGASLADRFAALGTLSDYHRPGHYMASATLLNLGLRLSGLVSRGESRQLASATAAGFVASRRASR